MLPAKLKLTAAKAGTHSSNMVLEPTAKWEVVHKDQQMCDTNVSFRVILLILMKNRSPTEVMFTLSKSSLPNLAANCCAQQDSMNFIPNLAPPEKRAVSIILGSQYINDSRYR